MYGKKLHLKQNHEIERFIFRKNYKVEKVFEKSNILKEINSENKFYYKKNYTGNKKSYI